MHELSIASREEWNGFRVYRFTGDGHPYLSVTHVLDYCSAKEQERWRTGKTAQEIKTTQDKGRVPGAKIHEAIHAYFRGTVPEITQDLEKVWDQFLAFKEAHHLNATQTEVPVLHSSLGYAGSMDWFGTFSSCDNALCCKPEYPKLQTVPAILDWKTGRSAGGTASVQLSAYRAAFMALNPLYSKISTVVVHLPRTGEPARAFVTQHLDKTTHAWACALDWFKFSNFYRLKKEGWPWLDVLATETLRKEWTS